MTEVLSQGNNAFVDEDYEEALKCYSRAIDEDDTNTEAYVKRATVLIKLGNHDEAIIDTKSALGIDGGNRLAFFRQGQAYCALNEFRSAKNALRQAVKLGETHVQCANLLTKCHEELGTTEEEDQKTIASNATATADAAVTNVSAPDTKAIPVLKPERIAHDWYQTAEFVTVSVMLKNIKPENVSVDFTAATMNCSVKLYTGADYILDLELCHKIVPESSKFDVRKTKIEIKMKKRTATQWKELEGEGTDASEASVRMAASKIVEEKPPGYEQGKKWDKIAQDIETEEKDTKLEGDAALNQLFKQIYGDADEATRRAMNKSFQESGGTVLSTNWKDIGKEKTEIKPPTGMEHKKWG